MDGGKQVWRWKSEKMDLHIICTAAILEGQVAWLIERAEKAQNQGGQAEQDLKGGHMPLSEG